jgi:hypothetical protein
MALNVKNFDMYAAFLAWRGTRPAKLKKEAGRLKQRTKAAEKS